MPIHNTSYDIIALYKIGLTYYSVTNW